jgi:hypothetical protein
MKTECDHSIGMLSLNNYFHQMISESYYISAEHPIPEHNIRRFNYCPDCGLKLFFEKRG